MLRRMTCPLLMCALALTGCNKPVEQAETPQPGPAAVPTGPAPEGQSEPMEEAAKTEAPAATPAAEMQGTTSNETMPRFQDLQPVAFYADEKVDVEIMDWKGVEKLVVANRGKVVVVDLWSLSCEPCRREFPHLVKLHNDKSDVVTCISVSTDYAGIKSKPPAFYQPKVLEFLTQQKATCKNVMCSVDSEALFESLKLASIPAVYVFGKDGKLAKRFAGEEVHYDKEVLPLVDELLKK